MTIGLLCQSQFPPHSVSAIGLATSDCVAIVAVIVGVLFQIARNKLPARLGTMMLVLCASAGFAAFMGAHAKSDDVTFKLDPYALSLLSAIWAGIGWMSAGKRDPTEFDKESRSAAAFFAWSLVFGIIASVMLIQAVVSATWARVLEAQAARDVLHTDGLISLGLLIVATVIWGLRGRRPQQPVMLLALSAVTVWWTSLMIPPAPSRAGYASEGFWGIRPGWWDWSFHLQFGLAGVLAIAAFLQDSRYRARRERAWPERLDDLLEPYTRWTAYIQVEAIIAASILVLGVYQIVRQEAASRPLAFASLTASLLAGTTCLFMTYRRWSGNTAGLGLALLSLAVVNIFIEGAAWWSHPHDWTVYSTRMPRLFNGVLFGLALMTVFWRWLGGVWKQQMLGDAPWTTAGRLIPFVRRTSFFLAALGVLVAFQMSMWPDSAPLADDDNNLGRLLCGAAAIGLFAVLMALRARRDDRPVAAGLALTFALALAVFLFIRTPSSPLRGWLIQHDAVVFSALALPLLLAAETAPKTQWRSFAVPLWFLAVLILPFWSLAQLLKPSSTEEWVRPLTYAILGAIYSFAATREHRRAFLVLGAAMLIASLASLYQAYGTATLAPRLGGVSPAGAAQNTFCLIW